MGLDKKEYEIIEIEPESEKREFNSKTEKKKTFLKSISGWMLSAVIFGSLAGGSFYGVSNLFEKNEASAVNAQVMTVSNSSNESSLDVSSVAKVGLPSIVSITNVSVQEIESYFGAFPGGRDQMQQEVESSGSGVIIEKTNKELYMLTNYHVIEGAKTLSVTFADNSTYKAQVVGYDQENDLAVLKVNVSDMNQKTLNSISVAKIGDSDKLKVGEQVVAIGNALGYGQSVTTGVVSAVDRTIKNQYGSQEYIQTDAAINPGNSGGALMNMKGELIGINTAKISSTNIEGMGYAIPIERVLKVIENNN